jgi:hypothetical protein
MTLSDIVHGIYLKFSVIYGERFLKNITTDELVLLWCHEWEKSLVTVPLECIRKALDECTTTFDWPPTLSEFIKLCHKPLGVPSFEEAFRLAARRDKSHPLVQIAYDKVGSWDMQNSKEPTLRPKFKAAYQEALKEYTKSHLQIAQTSIPIEQGCDNGNKTRSEGTSIRTSEPGFDSVRKAASYLLQ